MPGIGSDGQGYVFALGFPGVYNCQMEIVAPVCLLQLSESKVEAAALIQFYACTLGQQAM